VTVQSFSPAVTALTRASVRAGRNARNLWQEHGKKKPDLEQDGLLNAVVTRISLPLQLLGADVCIVMRQFGAVEVGVTPIYQINVISSCSTCAKWPWKTVPDGVSPDLQKRYTAPDKACRRISSPDTRSGLPARIR
jgi:hypothetical protein